MSDTDDTDDLLLIPPDLFAVNSDIDDSYRPYGPYYNVVDNLITQVHSLEGRINHIEALSDTSLMSTSLTDIDLMTGVRRFNSLDELLKPLVPYSESSQSTPQKPRSTYKQNSLPSTPNIDSIVKNRSVRSRYGGGTNSKQNSPSSRVGNIDLDEIATFISHVKNIQRYDAARNLNPLFEVASTSYQVPSKECESTQNNLHSSSITVNEPTATAEKLYRMGDTKGSVPDRGMGMRDILYETNADKNVQERSLSSLGSQPASSSDLQSARNSESVKSDAASFSSSGSTPLTTVRGDLNKIHTSAVDILDKHKNLLSHSDNNTFHLSDDSKQKNFIKDTISDPTTEKRRLVLMSLSELWNENLDAGGDYNSWEYLMFYNKLQEEKLRRQHCEEVIHHLQARMLDQQERLAVALRIDEAKDDAILEIHKSMEEASTKIENLHKDKTQLELKIFEINSKASTELVEATKKIDHYESESSKALNLAHNNQEKVTSLEKQNAVLLTDIQSYEDRLKKLTTDFEHEHNNNQQLSKLLSQKEVELNQNKNLQALATNEIAQSKRAVEMCQSEITSIKGKQTQLEARYNETLSQVKDLESDKKKLLTQIENYKKTEKNIKEELSRLKETSEHSKADLRTFYQNQVEILVREKLKEFQQQLEKAEGSLQEEIRSRELSIAKNAAIHIQQINEKNAVEIHLLEEKHKEEMKLHKLQLFQLQQEKTNLQMKIQQQQDRRANIVQQLQRIMEAQWSEALKIINNGKSPIVAEDKSTNTIDQLNHLKSRSYSNLEEVLLRDDTNIGRNVPAQGSNALRVKLFENISMNSTLDDVVETPRTSRHEKHKQHSENELQKYIQMLLHKQPGHPYNEQVHPEDYENQLQADGTKHKISSKDRFGKPPWK